MKLPSARPTPQVPPPRQARDLVGHEGPWITLAASRDATTWRAGSSVVRADGTGRNATVLPVLERLGVPVPALCAHHRLDDGRHLVVVEHVAHRGHRPQGKDWAAAAQAVEPLHRSGRQLLESCGVAMDDYVASQTARFRARLALLEQHGRHELVAHLSREAEHALAAFDNTPRVATHTDLHGGNVLVTHSGSVVLVDWDLLRLAPAELDLAALAADVRLGINDPADLTLALRSRPELDRARVARLGKFKAVTAASWFQVEALTRPDLRQEADDRVASLDR